MEINCNCGKLVLTQEEKEQNSKAMNYLLDLIDLIRHDQIKCESWDTTGTYWENLKFINYEFLFKYEKYFNKGE